MRDLSEFMTFPFEPPMTVRELQPPVAEEPPRAGEQVAAALG